MPYVARETASINLMQRSVWLERTWAQPDKGRQGDSSILSALHQA